MDTTILTNNGVNIEKGLESLGDMEMYNDTLKDFLEESKTRIPAIVEYYNAHDMENYSILVHAMKGDSKYLGFETLVEMSYNHEMASKENNYEYVSANINALIEEANRIIALIHQYFGM